MDEKTTETYEYYVQVVKTSIERWKVKASSDKEARRMIKLGVGDYSGSARLSVRRAFCPKELYDNAVMDECGWIDG